MRNATEVAKEAKYTRLANGDLAVEGAAIIYKNFSGDPTTFNPSGGKRTFSLVVPQDIADSLVEEGWNVKHRSPREEGDDDMFYTEVVVNLNSQFPPKLHLITKFGERERIMELNEDNVSELDKNYLKVVDLVIHPYNHGRMNAAGATVKGYLKTLYATMEPASDFGGKYDRFYMGDDEPEELPFQ